MQRLGTAGREVISSGVRSDGRSLAPKARTRDGRSGGVPAIPASHCRVVFVHVLKKGGRAMPRVLNYRIHGCPDGAVYIGRPVPSKRRANPYPLRRNDTREERAQVIAKYERHRYDSGLVKDVHELRGRDLVCGAPQNLVTATCCSGSPMLDRSPAPAAAPC